MTTPQPPKVLCSFHYFRTGDVAAFARGGALIMGDSGAFSAASSGSPIRYEQYVAWVRRHGDALFSYPALDVIGDPRATWDNHQRMLRDGLAPLPVYHYGSPMTYLRRYLDAGERYIALGGLVGQRGKDTKQWILACFRAAEPYGAVFHGFGRTRTEDLRDFPWYSVDSSSLTRAVRFGLVDLFDGHKFTVLKRSEPKSLYRHGRLLRAHGTTPAALDNRTEGSRLESYRVGVTGWRRAEEWLRLRHGPVPGPRPGDPDGPHLFLADTSAKNIHYILDTARRLPGPFFPHRHQGGPTS